MLQLHLSDQQFYCIPGASYIGGLTVDRKIHRRAYPLGKVMLLEFWGKLSHIIMAAHSQAWEWSGFKLISGILPLAKYMKSAENLTFITKILFGHFHDFSYASCHVCPLFAECLEMWSLPAWSYMKTVTRRTLRRWWRRPNWEPSQLLRKGELTAHSA